jgi:hypothetical protein
MKQSVLHLSAVLAVALMAGACATETRLEPDPVAVMKSSDQQCIGGCEGVRLVVDPDAWRGAPEITNQITPIQIRVKNEHGSAIRLLYRHFVLVAPDGKRFSALPPFEIVGTVDVGPPPASLSGPPAFHSRDFFVSPRHHAFVPGVPSTGRPFPYDPLYYERYHGEWGDIDLPTQHMKVAALPEGDIEDQGEVTGFVYFERVQGVEKVELHMDLMEAEDGTLFGRVRLPFLVVKDG